MAQKRNSDFYERLRQPLEHDMCRVDMPYWIYKYLIKDSNHTEFFNKNIRLNKVWNKDDLEKYKKDLKWKGVMTDLKSVMESKETIEADIKYGIE